MQADLGFFYYGKKKYGIFIVFVQTYTGKIFASPLPNTSQSTLIKSVEKMLQVRDLFLYNSFTR